MRANRKRAAIVSLLLLLVCVSVLTLATYALFSDSAKTNNHLEAGTLKVGLYQTETSGLKPDADGRLERYSSSERIDLTKDSAKLFEMANVCPGTKKAVTLQVSNDGTTAFSYSVRIVDLTADNVGGAALSDQMQVTVSRGDFVRKFFLSDYATGDNEMRLGEILQGGAAQTFTVEVEFISGEGNNEAQSGAVSFDLTVTAVQLTEVKEAK